MSISSRESIYRIIDANTNRAIEGTRVCEEIARFMLNRRQLTAQLKNTRHKICSILDSLGRKEFIKKRNSAADVGRTLFGREMQRKDTSDIFFANIQRVKESIRVLEEFSKLLDKKSALGFKRLRYQIYEIEKKITLELSSLSGVKQEILRRL